MQSWVCFSHQAFLCSQGGWLLAGLQFFCFGYYFHSPQHVVEFRESKLGAFVTFPPDVLMCFLQTAVLLEFCYWVVEDFALPILLPTLLQGNSSGVSMPSAPLPPHMRYVPPAWSFSLLWRCTAGGSCWRIVAICKVSSCGPTWRPSSRRMSSVAFFSTWSATTTRVCLRRCRKSIPERQ